MSTDLDLSQLSHAEKDALILRLLARLEEAHKLIAELRARIDDLTRSPKTPDNSSVPPSKGQKANRPDKAKHQGPRKGSLGRKGGGRARVVEPDEVVLAKPARCRHCQAAFIDTDQTLDARHDKIDLPRVRPVVTRVERYAGHCRCCGASTLAAVPEGLEPGTPFSPNIVAPAMYLRFVHAVSHQRLTRLLLDLLALRISEGALGAVGCYMLDGVLLSLRNGRPHGWRRPPPGRGWRGGSGARPALGLTRTRRRPMRWPEF